MQSKPKVLFVFSQTKNKANGGANSLVEIMLNLNRITPVVLTQYESPAVDRLRQGGVKVVIWPDILNLPKSLKGLVTWLGFGPRLFNLIRKEKIKTVHLNDIQSLAYCTWFLKVCRTRIIFNIRDVREPGEKYGRHWLLANLVHEIIVLSGEMKKELSERLPLVRKKYWAVHIHAIYSIIDFDRFPDDAQPPDSKSGIAYIAAFNNKKNQYEFIQKSLPALADKGIPVHFVGDVQNEYGMKCQKLATELGLGDFVNFHGYQSNISDWYRRATITAIASRREGLARCMIESLASGTPVVSFDVCSAREILEGHHCGVVISQGQYRDFSAEIIELFENQNRYQKFRANGIDVARRLFQKEKVIPAYERIYLGEDS